MRLIHFDEWSGLYAILGHIYLLLNFFMMKDFDFSIANGNLAFNEGVRQFLYNYYELDAPFAFKKGVSYLNFGRSRVLIGKGADVIRDVRSGIAKLGIVGLDVLREEARVDEFNETLLDFGYCSLEILVREEDFELQEPLDLEEPNFRRKYIVSRYVKVVGEYLRNKGVGNPTIYYAGGEEERRFVNRFAAFGVIVETGASMRRLRLRSIGKILESQAVLIKC